MPKARSGKCPATTPTPLPTATRGICLDKGRSERTCKSVEDRGMKREAQKDKEP